MGQSTDGILVFGVDLGEELPEFLQDIEDEDGEGTFDALLCQKAGIPQYGEEGYDYHAKAAFLEKQPLAMITHCSGDYPMYILGVRASHQTASRGSPQEVSMDLSSEAVYALNALLAEHGITDEPKWLLASIWN